MIITEGFGGISHGSAVIRISSDKKAVVKGYDQHQKAACGKPQKRSQRACRGQKYRSRHDKGSPANGAA